LPVHKYALSVAEGTRLVGDGLGPGSSVAISPDGTKLIFAAFDEGTSYLYLCNMDEFEAQRFFAGSRTFDNILLISWYL